VVSQWGGEAAQQGHGDGGRPAGGADDGEATAVPDRDRFQHCRVLDDEHSAVGRTFGVQPAQLPRSEQHWVAEIGCLGERPLAGSICDRPQAESQYGRGHAVAQHTVALPELAPVRRAGGRGVREGADQEGRQGAAVVECMRVACDGRGELGPQSWLAGSQRCSDSQCLTDDPQRVRLPGEHSRGPDPGCPVGVDRRQELQWSPPGGVGFVVGQRPGGVLDDLLEPQPRSCTKLVVELGQDEGDRPGDRLAQDGTEGVPGGPVEVGEPAGAGVAHDRRAQASPDRLKVRVVEPGREGHA
jgi:hypothetical protein